MSERGILHQWTDPVCAMYRRPVYPIGRFIHWMLGRLRCDACRFVEGSPS